MVEALAYRTLVEGHDGQPPRPEVLRDLINDGALDLPFCFGRGDAPPKECADAPASNPLLAWPQPLTDRPDAAFRRQFSDAGQCFHYMATLDDAQSDALPGTAVPRALATSAVVRCNDLLDGLLRQVVVIGGPATRRSSHGLYEFMHAVGDSFSGLAHREDGRRKGRVPAGLAADRAAREAAPGALGAHPRDRVPQVGRPPGQDVRRGGGRRRLREADGPSLRRPLRVPVSRGRRGAARAHGSPRPRARPSRRAARGAAGDGHGAGALGRVARVQGEVVRARPSLRGRGVRRAREAGPAARPLRLARPRRLLEPDARLRRHRGARHAREVLGGPESVPLRAERERRLPPVHGRRRRGGPRRARVRLRAARRAALHARLHAHGPSRDVRRREGRAGARVAAPALHVQAEGRALPLGRRADGGELAEAPRGVDDRRRPRLRPRVQPALEGPRAPPAEGDARHPAGRRVGPAARALRAHPRPQALVVRGLRA